MSEVEFDGPAAARLQVYEDQSVLRGQHVARVRLAVQQLLGPAAAGHPPQVSQRAAEELPVGVGERRSAVAVGNELLGLLYPVGEVRRGEIELAHAVVQSRERTGVGGWRGLVGWRGFVIGPQRDREIITLVDAWLHARLKGSHGAAGSREPLGKLDFELRDPMVRRRGHPCQHVARQQAQSELVRVLENDRVVGGQAKRRGDRQGGCNRTRDLRFLHPFLASLPWCLPYCPGGATCAPYQGA